MKFLETYRIAVVLALTKAQQIGTPVRRNVSLGLEGGEANQTANHWHVMYVPVMIEGAAPTAGVGCRRRRHTQRASQRTHICIHYGGSTVPYRNVLCTGRQPWEGVAL